MEDIGQPVRQTGAELGTPRRMKEKITDVIKNDG
jgi:hypothetical protein